MVMIRIDGQANDWWLKEITEERCIVSNSPLDAIRYRDRAAAMVDACYLPSGTTYSVVPCVPVLA